MNSEIENLFERKKILQSFLSEVISSCPNDSLWGIQGLYERHSQELLSSYLTSENCHFGPIEATYLIKINDESKVNLAEIILTSDIVYDILHQFICKDNVVYFESYDFLQHNTLSEGLLSFEQIQFYKKEGII